MDIEDFETLTEAQVSKKLDQLRASVASQPLADRVVDCVASLHNFHTGLFSEIAATFDEFAERTADVEILKKILKFFKDNLSKCDGPAAEHFVFVALVVHAHENDALDGVAGEILEAARIAAAKNDDTFQAIVAVLKARIIPKLKAMADAKNYAQSLAIWRAIVRATRLRMTTPVTNDVLLIATMAFKESDPNCHALAFKSWRVLIDNLPAEILRRTAYIRLVLNPLNRTYRDTDANSTLQKYVAWWQLVVTLEEDAEENFDEVVVPLLQKVFCMPSAKARLVNPTAFANPTRTIPLFAYTVLALLWYDGGDELRQDVERLGEPHFRVSRHRMKASCLAKHFAVFEEALTLVVNNVTQNVCAPPKHYAFLLCRLLYARIGSFYENDHRDMVRLTLSTIHGLVQTKLLDVRQTLKIFQDLSEGLPLKVMSSSQFNFRKGVFSMHECPLLTLTNVYVRHVAQLCEASGEETNRNAFRQGLRTLLERGSGSINVLRFVGHLVASLHGSEALTADAWLEISSLLTKHITHTRDVNQGGPHEHDFSATLSTLAFPIDGSFPLTNEVVKSWIQLFNVFSVEAVLVKNLASNQHIAELCSRLDEQLAKCTFVDLGQLLLISQIFGAVLKHCCFDRCVVPSTQRLPKLGHLDSFTKCIGRVIRGGWEHLAEKKLKPRTVCQFYVNVVAIVATLLRDAQSSDLFEHLILELLPTLAPILEIMRHKSTLRSSPLVHVESALVTQLGHVVSALKDKSDQIPKQDESFLCAIRPVVERLSGHWRFSIREAAHALSRILSISTGDMEQCTQSLSGIDSVPDATAALWPGASTDATEKESSAAKMATRSLPDTPTRKSEAGCDSKEMIALNSRRRTRLASEEEEAEFVPIRSPKKTKQIFTEHQLEKFSESRVIPCMYEDLSQSSQGIFAPAPLRQTESRAENTKVTEVAEVGEAVGSPSSSSISTPSTGKEVSTTKASRKSVPTKRKLAVRRLKEHSGSEENLEAGSRGSSADTSPEIQTLSRTCPVEDQNRENEEPRRTTRSHKEGTQPLVNNSPSPAQITASSPAEVSERVSAADTRLPDSPSNKPRGARKRKLGRSYHSPIVAKLEAKKMNAAQNLTKRRSRRSLNSCKFPTDETSQTLDSESSVSFDARVNVKSEPRSRGQSESSSTASEVEDETVRRARKFEKHSTIDPARRPQLADDRFATNNFFHKHRQYSQQSLVGLIKAAQGAEREQVLRFVSSPEFLQLMTSDERKSFLAAFLANVSEHIS